MWADKTKTFDGSALFIIEEFMEEGVIQCCSYCDIYFHRINMISGLGAYSDHDYCKPCYPIVKPTHDKLNLKNLEILRRINHDHTSI